MRMDGQDTTAGERPGERPVGPGPDAIERLAGGLVVSCQADASEPLHGPAIMAAFACAAIRGGARGLRANGPEDIRAIRAAVDAPIIGIWKVDLPDMGTRITPTLEHARGVAAAGASIIALDATLRPRADGWTTATLIERVRVDTGLPVMADVATVTEGLAAQDAGADLVATTLAGYTQGSEVPDGPDLDLVEQLATRLRVPVVAEGRISTPAQAAEALARGAYAVVVGHAITRPEWITGRFVAWMDMPSTDR